jgi:hypothetical protein
MPDPVAELAARLPVIAMLPVCDLTDPLLVISTPWLSLPVELAPTPTTLTLPDPVPSTVADC